MMLYIFNQAEQLQAILKPNTSPTYAWPAGETYFFQPQYPAPDEAPLAPATACPYYDAVHTEKLTGENTFTFTVPANHPDSQFVVEGNLVAFKDLDANWQLFEIKRVTDVHGDSLTRTAFCEHAFYELIDDFIEDIRPYNVSAHFAMTQALSGTRWSVGDVADLGLNSTNFYYENVLSAIQKVASVWHGELRFRVVVTGGVISARYVDLLARRGAEPVMTITPSDYFRKDNPVKWSEIANYIEVETQPLRPDVVQEVCRSNEPVPITAGQTKTITVYYNHTPCIEATATLENAVSGVQITKATYYAWGADITVTSTNTGTFELVINAKPLKVLNKEKAIAKDNASITDNGMLKYTFPANSLVQTREVAQKIANTLLAYYKDPRRDVEVEWRGNPALLLGDRIAVIDKNETNEYYVTKQELEFDGALRARLSGRRA
jgi:hypothetical protein